MTQGGDGPVQEKSPLSETTLASRPDPERRAAELSERGRAALTATSGLDTVSRARPPLQAAHSALPRLAIAGRAPGPAELELHAVIGEGGMGLVRSAVQLSIGREVAVKTVHPSQRENAVILRDLLTEAQITGSLEHPNIVPIYSVGCDDAGLPLIVMKRIDGAAWSSVLSDPKHPALAEAREDPLQWHLSILGQVCRAVHFAHSRGIVHRDLKPANVMIGAFGEVYVLDWGLALHVDPWTHEASPPAGSGTPAYMAPEMLDPAEGAITPRTDVFLLGAILYEILTGSPPWAAQSLSAALAKARECAPSLDDIPAPQPLLDIARRALAKDPKDRFDSPESLRLAVEAFLRYRGAASLAEHAERRLRELRTLTESSGGKTSRDEARIHGLFGECRFGFDQALDAWPEADSARLGRVDAYLLMIDFELRARRPGAAAALLDELDEPPAELRDRVRSLRRALALDAARLRMLEREVDVNASVELRQRLFIVGCTSTAAFNALAELLDRLEIYRMEYLAFGAFNVLALLILALMWTKLGAAELRTTFNRVYGMAFSATCASTLLLWVGLGSAGVPFKLALVLANVPQIVGAATVAFGIDLRMRWLPVLYCATAVLGLLWTEHVYIWATLSSLLGILVLVVAWGQPRPEVVRTIDLGKPDGARAASDDRGARPDRER